jgi:hypothetical protein
MCGPGVVIVPRPAELSGRPLMVESYIALLGELMRNRGESIRAAARLKD